MKREPAPCKPADPTAECRRCSRHAPGLLDDPTRRPRQVAIDASAIPKADGKCPMFTASRTSGRVLRFSEVL